MQSVLKSVASVLMVASLLQPVSADAAGRWESDSGGTYWTSGEELACLGLPAGGYTGATLWDGWSSAVMDESGRLHVTAHGTYAWAVFPYSDSITGPYDTNHRLAFGATEIHFSYVIADYTPGDTWSYILPTVDVSGSVGSATLNAEVSLSFSAQTKGPGDIGTGIGFAHCPI